MQTSAGPLELQAVFEECVVSLFVFLYGGQGVTEGPDLQSFTSEPIINSSLKIHLKASFPTVTCGGSPKDRVLCNSALGTEERLFHDRKLALQVGEKGFCRAGVKATVHHWPQGTPISGDADIP